MQCLSTPRHYGDCVDLPRWTDRWHYHSYLLHEYQNKCESPEAIEIDKLQLQVWSPEVPQQTNGSDCGVFVLQYVEHFFASQHPAGCGPFVPGVSKAWFSERAAVILRRKMAKLIQALSNTEHRRTVLRSVGVMDDDSAS